MVLYECFRCGYNTTLKGNMKTHLNRKNICNSIEDDVDIEEIKKYYGFESESKMNPNESKMNPDESKVVNQNESKMNPNESKKNEIESKMNPKKHTCIYCTKCFTTNSNMRKHEKTCKKKEDILVISQGVEMFKIKKELEALKNFKIQTQNNTTNNITTNNNTNNNIIINNYGNENIEHISKKYLLNIFSKTYSAVPRLIEKIHFDPEHPENQNIKLPNKKLPYIKIKKNDKWQFVDRKSEIINLIDAMCFILSENFQNMNLKGKNNLNERQKNVIEKYLEKYRNDDKKLMNELENIVDLTLINNSL